MARCRDSILLYGDTGDGKTALIGEFAEWLYATERKRTRLYAGDLGGYRTVEPYINLGVIEVVDVAEREKPWEWLQAVTVGKIPGPNGNWILDEGANEGVGAFVFEGFTAFGEALMTDLARRAAGGANIGGQSPAVMFKEGEAQMAGNSPAHFGIVQTQLTMAAWNSFRLPGYVVWTASARRASDNDTNAPILGPQIVGKALTSEVPRWFVYTFRVMQLPADGLVRKVKEHRLFFEDHTDTTMPGAKGLGNDRLPLDAEPLPPYIAPASLVKALQLIRERSAAAEEKIRARLRLGG